MDSFRTIRHDVFPYAGATSEKRSGYLHLKYYDYLYRNKS